MAFQHWEERDYGRTEKEERGREKEKERRGCREPGGLEHTTGMNM